MTPAGGRRRLWWLCGVGVAALLVVTAVAQGDRATTDLELSRREAALDRGCDAPAAAGPEPPAFLLEGELEAVTASPRGGALLDLVVGTWFRGPPLERVDVRVAAADLRALEQDGRLRPGSRLVVRGAAWQVDGSAPVVGCADVLGWTESLDESLRAEHPPATTASQDGPVASYPGPTWTRSGPVGGPVLTGVLLVHHGCLHVDDGLARWLLLLPEGEAAWEPGSRSLVFDGEELDAGRTVRLAGSAQTALFPRPGQQLTRDLRPAARLLDRSGLTCAEPGPTFVVSRRPAGGSDETVLTDDDPLVATVHDTATERGVPVTGARAVIRSDGFAGTSVVVELETAPDGGAGTVTVLLDTAPALAWPDAYLDDEGLRGRLGEPACADDDQHADGDDEAAAGTEPRAWGEVVVQRGPDLTRVLVHAPGAPLATVTARAALDDDGVCDLADVGRAALRP